MSLLELLVLDGFIVVFHMLAMLLVLEVAADRPRRRGLFLRPTRRLRPADLDKMLSKK